MGITLHLVVHFLSRGLGVVWVDDRDGAGALWSPPLMSLLRYVSQLMPLKACRRPRTIEQSAGSVEPASFIFVLLHRSTPGMYAAWPATASHPQPVGIDILLIMLFPDYVSSVGNCPRFFRRPPQRETPSPNQCILF